MEQVKDLSKDELLSIINMHFPLSKEDKVECVICCQKSNVLSIHFYVCDKCEQAMIEDRYIKTDKIK